MRILALLLAASAAVAADQPPPGPAISARIAARESYRLVFNDEFNEPMNRRRAGPPRPAANWFRSFFFGQAPSPAEMFSVAHGALTMTGTEALGATIATAGSTPGPNGWGGRVFRNGAYFEARIALGPDQPGSATAWAGLLVDGDRAYGPARRGALAGPAGRFLPLRGGRFLRI